MAKIEVFRLDIDVDAAIKAQSELKEKTDTLKTALDALKKSGDTNSRTYVEMEAAYKQLNKEYNAGQTQLGKMIDLQAKEIKTVQEGRNALTILNREWAKATNLYGENSKEAQELATKHKVLKDRVNELQKGIGDTSANIGRYTEGMTEALNKTSLFGGTVSNVKEYLSIFGAVFKTAGQQAKAATDQIRNAAAGTEGMTAAQKALTVATNVSSGAFKLLKVALASTGIGLLVIALGSLVAYLTTTQKGIDTVSKVLTPLKFVFESLVGVLQKVGEYLFNAFANPQKTIKEVYDFVKDKVIKVFSGYFDILAGIATMDFTRVKEGVGKISDVAQEGIDAIKGAGARLSKTMQEAYNRGVEVDRLTKQLAKSEADFITSQGRLKEELKQQNLIAEDQNKTLAEREAAAKRTIDIAKEINDQQRERLEIEKNILVLQSQNAATSDKERAEIAQKIAEINAANAQMLEIETTQQNKLNAIRKEAANQAIAARQKILDDAAVKAKLELDLYLQSNDQKARSLKEELQLAENVRDKKLAIAQKEFEATKKTENDKLELLIAQNEAKLEFLETTANLSVEYAEKELEYYIATNRSKIDSETRLTEAIIEEENKRLEAIKENQLQVLEKQLETNQSIIDNKIENNEELTVQDLEYLTKKADLEDEYTKQILANEKALKEEARAQEAEDLATAYEVQKAEAATKYEEEIIAEQERYEAEQAKLKKRFEDGLLTQAQFNALSQALEKQHSDNLDKIHSAMFENKTQLASQAFGNLATILGKESKAGKAAATFQATIDTVSAAISAYKAMAGIPIVGPILGALASAAALAAGYANVKKINSTPEPSIPKAEKGALFKIGGRRHSQGGTKFRGEDGTMFEAEKDELIGVMNTNAAAAFMAFNDAYPSGAGTRVPNYMATGGIVNRINSQGLGASSRSLELDYNSLGQKVTEGVSNIQFPPIYVAVTDINTEQGKYAKVVEGANF